MMFEKVPHVILSVILPKSKPSKHFFNQKICTVSFFKLYFILQETLVAVKPSRETGLLKCLRYREKLEAEILLCYTGTEQAPTLSKMLDPLVSGNV